MMIIRSPILRATTALITRISPSFSNSLSLYDPSKHCNMSHIIHTQYVDYWDLGQYPDVYPVGSVCSRVYQPQV
jgi:hypothetical protein